MVSTGVLGMQDQMDFGAAAARPGCAGGQDVATGAGAGQDGGVRALEGAQEAGRVIRFTVPGAPVGKGRPKVASRGGRFAQLYTPEKTANYEGLVAHAGQVAMNGRDLIAGAVSVQLDIRLPVPASWSKRKQSQALDGQVLPTKKPDIDNVEKAIFDGLNGVVWNDDVQVVDVSKRKRYSAVPGVQVVIREVKGGE